MKRRKGSRARGFILRYPERHNGLLGFSGVVQSEIVRILEPLNLELHLISARAKGVSSAIAKVRRKGYGNPWRQLTDQVGVRVITYYPEDVDLAAAELRARLEIDEARSIDKRSELQVRQFGYRSFHLVARFGDKHPLPTHRDLRSLWFEIQIRSILEHSWAEIEHEICYKSGLTYSEPILRQFGALAGSLEILDGEFSRLRSEKNKLVDLAKSGYSKSEGMHTRLDTARLIAILELHYPDGPGWRRAGTIPSALPPKLQPTCVDALHAVGLNSAWSLLRILRSPSCRTLVKSFAGLQGIAPSTVSHLALVILAVAVKSKIVLRRFPELLADPRANALIYGVSAV